METVNEQQALVKMLDPFYTKMANHLLAQGVKYVNRRGWPVIHNSKGHKCAVGVIFPDVKKARNDGFMLSGNNLMLLLQAIEPEKHEVSKHELVSELNERASIHDSWEPKSWEGILLKHSEKKRLHMATHNIKYRSGFKFAYINGYEDLPEDARKTLIDLTLKDWPASAIVYRLATIHHLEFSKSAIEHEMHRIRKGYGIKPGDMVGREARR